MSELNPLVAEPEILPTLRDLVARAQDGNEAARPELRRVLDDHAAIWR